MTDETQAFVERLLEEGESRIDHRAGDYAGELLLEAAAALTTLARDLEMARSGVGHCEWCPHCHATQAAREGRE